MAQDQRVEFLFAAQVSGQEQLQKLISSVDSLRKETEQLKTANSGLASSTNAVISNGVRYNNALDAQSRALRQNRQGTQQLGLQINDFATSVSTGASPLQAFNQQIGQVGYAMSQMGGVAGKVGAFLAGPWGAAVVLGTMAVSALFNIMNQAPEVNDKFATSLDRSRDALLDYQVTLAKTRGEVLALYEAKLAGLQFEFQKSATDAGKFGRQVADSRKILDNWSNTPVWKVGVAMYQNATATTKFNEAQVKTLDINTEMIQLQNTLAKMRQRHAKEDDAASARSLKAAQSAFNKMQAKGEAELEQANKIAEKIRDLALVYGATSKEVGTTAKKLDDFNDMVKQLGTLNGGPAILQQLAGAIELVRGGIVDEGGKKALADYNAEIDKLITKDMTPFERSISSLQEKLKNQELTPGILSKENPEKYYSAINSAANKFFDDAITSQTDLLSKALGVDDAFKVQVASLEAIIAKMTELGVPTDDVVAKLQKLYSLSDETKMAEKNKELQDSFEAIGTAVSNSFKGMITGAMSFSSAMKGIISSVIDELIRLYVVQQIVGVVKSALGGIGLPVPALPGKKAIGGSVGKNRPYMVGEQGPELFIPGGSGTIIPNRNLSGGGGGNSINVSVDARGASDPAAVRAQVQQGIIEAAPAIIAAAESRTVAGLRRPRLGGVMQ